MIAALDEKPARLWGFVAVAFMAGLAVGNGWTTHQALDGSGKWWARYCHVQVQKHVQLQEKLDNQ